MFAVLGEALLDMVQRGNGHTYAARPGGSPFNIAIGLRRLDHDTALMARLSRGGLGAILREHAAANSLDLSACVDTDDAATLAFASVDADGRASYDFYVDGTADWGWTPAELRGLPDATKVVHTGSLATAISPGSEALLAMVERLHAHGAHLLSYDPNVRPALAGRRDDAVERTERYVGASHVVKASDDDLAWLYPGLDLADVMRRWLELGPELMVVTRGESGCLAMTARGASMSRDGLSVKVVDTIGAGDSFQSGLLSALADAECTTPGSVGQLSTTELEVVLDRALRVSAMTCEREGADPPTRAEYDARRSGDGQFGG
ncbi:MAG: carbohydrate kinase [Nocardioidaceae bacterium]